MNHRYPLVPNRTGGYDCLDADCDRKTWWSIESAPMQYRAYSCREHLAAVCEEIVDMGDRVMRIAAWG